MDEQAQSEEQTQSSEEQNEPTDEQTESSGEQNESSGEETGSSDEDPQSRAEETKNAWNEAEEKMRKIEEDPPKDLEDWPDDEAKYVTFGGGEGDHGYEEGPEAKLGPSGLRRFEDGSITIDNEEVDDPEQYKADEPIEGATQTGDGDE